MLQRNRYLARVQNSLLVFFGVVLLSVTVRVQQLLPVFAQEQLPPELAEPFVAPNSDAVTPTVNADGVTPTPEMSAAELDALAAIQEKQRLEGEIVTVLQTYRGQLETYRGVEKDYAIAYDVFKSTPTLVAIDKAVAATRSLLVARTDVLETYLTLLRLRLIMTEGIEVTIKEKTLNKLELYISELEKYSALSHAAETRDGVNLAVSYFSDLGKGIEIVASEAQGLIALGRLQSSYDQSQVIQRELKLRFEESKRTPAQSRSIEQTDAALSEANELLKIAWLDLQKQVLKGDFSDFYRDRVRVLNPTYAKLTRVASYQAELLTL